MNYLRRLDPVPMGLPLGLLFTFVGGWLGWWSLTGTLAGVIWMAFIVIWVAVFLWLEWRREAWQDESQDPTS